MNLTLFDSEDLATDYINMRIKMNKGSSKVAAT